MGNWWRNRGRYLPETCYSQSDSRLSSCKGKRKKSGSQQLDHNVTCSKEEANILNLAMTWLLMILL
jgi:hypothetical protein